MKRIRSFLLFGLTLFVFGSLIFPENLGEAVSKGKVSLNLRYRYEFVNQDGFDKNANANTLRLRLGYTTRAFYNFSLHVDLESNHVIGPDNFNSTDNGKVEYPVVADPPDTELNQAFLAHTGLVNSEFKLGRQRIKLDNDRFIGNVGWRQNEQTYDAFRFSNSYFSNMTLNFAYFDRVNRIFGAHHSTRSHINTRSYVFHANYRFAIGGLSAYAYLLENRDRPEASHQNFGLRFTGSTSIKDSVRLLYTLEAATQQAYQGGSEDIDVNYGTVELGGAWKGLTAKLGYEVLGGNGRYGFSTPFATLHAFNGWADRFLGTPKNGLADGYLLLGLDLMVVNRSLTLKAIYHDFRSVQDSVAYGTELDLLVQMPVWADFVLMIKYAGYKAKDFATDTTKFWVAAQYSF